VIRVLLVEDNEGFAYGVRDMLVVQRPEPFEVKTVGTLNEAITALAEDSPHVILLDLGLPDSARIDTFRRVHDNAGYTPIIILTVLDDDEVAMAAMRAGAQDYLVKDELTEVLLIRSIKYAIERMRIERALSELSGRLLRLQDEERRRIARELHDATAQSLAALSMNLAALKAKAPDLNDEARRLLSDSLECLSQCSADLRTATYLLHPPLLDELGLAGAVRDYADGFAKRSGIRVDLELPHHLKRLPRDVELALFRIMQESLSNVHKHSESPSASIRFELRDKEIAMEIADSGHGLMQPPGGQPDERAATGVGIAGMRERARQLGGQLDIVSSSSGTTAKAVLPLRSEVA